MKTLLPTICLLACAMLFAQQNLLKPVSDQWEVGRNAENGSTFEVIEYEGKPAFHINLPAAEGYTMYRDFPKVAPGEYTFLCQAFGDTRHGLYAEIYSFDKDGKPTLIMSCHSPAGSIAEPMTMYDTLAVPANSAYLRVGVGIAGQGEGTFFAPQLLAFLPGFPGFRRIKALLREGSRRLFPVQAVLHAGKNRINNVIHHMHGSAVHIQAHGIAVVFE